MARTTKAAVLDTEVDEVETGLTPKQIINEGIDTFSDSVTVTGQHFRYKSLRAIAYQAFTEAIEAGEFEDLVQRAIANAGDLPSGWEVEKSAPAEKPAKAEKAPAAKPARKPAAKSTSSTTKAKATTATAKAAAKPAARKRPTR